MADIGDPEKEEKERGTRKPCTLSPLTLRRLERLAKRETYGTTVPRVMTNLIEAGLRQAIKDGFLTEEEVSG